MKKRRLIVIVLLITGMALVFSKNIKTHIQAENLSLTQNVYNFLMDEGNRRDIYSAAIELNQGSSKNTCVYFISEVLRQNNFNVPKETSNTAQLIALLNEKGFKKQSDYENLTPGDICFTTNENENKDSSPSHTYVFMKWVKPGKYDYAYVCDNQAKDYKNKVYHIRNINVRAKANGFDKDVFAFFMKKS